MTLFREGKETVDDWVRVADGDPVPSAGKVILTKAQFLAERDGLRGRNAPVGVVFAASETPDDLADDIHRLSLVVLDIPRYADGRLYSVARVLRERYGYAGEIRACGDVLRDQITFLHRVGVDSFEVSHPGTIAALREGTIVSPANHTQAAAREAEEERSRVRSWRRVSPRGSVPGVR